MTAQPPHPDVEVARTEQPRWEKLPGGALVGIALGIAFSMVCWAAALIIFSRAFS